MLFPRHLVVLLGFAAILPLGCLRQRHESPLLASLGKEKLPAPQPPLPTSASSSDALPRVGGGVQPPQFDRTTRPVPPLPGMPGSPSQPTPPASVPDSPQSKAEPLDRNLRLTSATDEEEERQRKGLLERLRERRQEKRDRELPKLPPAVEPRTPEPKRPRPDDALPKLDPQPETTRPITPAPAPAPVAAGDLKTVREIVETAAKKNAATASFEAHLVKREVVNGRQQPAEEAVYKFRQEPRSVHIRVTGEVGTGREVMWVKGENDNNMTIVTGKGDNILFGAGKKMTMDPDSPLVASKSRYKIYEAGMQRPIGALTKFVEEAEAGKRPADSIRSLGLVEREEYSHKLHGVEVVLNATDDPFLPKGGKRLYYFDADPKSPAVGLPVLIISLDHNDKEAEYYCFTDFKRVGELTDADFDHTKLGRKR